MRRRSPAVLVGLVVLAGPAAVPDELVVDLSRPLGPATQRACGFLHGIQAARPDESLLSPLKIRYIRGTPVANTWGLPPLLSPDLFPRIQATGARLAFGFWYDKTRVAGHDTYWPGDQGDWASWEGIVGSTLSEVLGRGIDCDWVIWNEPDHKRFWARDVDRYRETWRRAYRKIKSVRPAAIVTGPTLARYSFEYLTSFLAYCKENACVPDRVTWHELTTVEKEVAGHVEAVRLWCRTRNVPIRDIVIDEYGGPGGDHLPGPAVGFFSALEAARVTYASRAIWGKTGTLCGLTSEDGTRPLSIWWAYKAYSDAEGTLYEVAQTASIKALAVVRRNAESAVLLIGNQSGEERPVAIGLRNPAGAGLEARAFRVRRHLIPNSGADVLDRPIPLQPLEVDAVEQTIRIDLGRLSGYAAMEVVLDARQP